MRRKSIGRGQTPEVQGQGDMNRKLPAQPADRFVSPDKRGGLRPMSNPLKIVVAFEDKERGCFAKEGELLVAASPEAKAEVKLREHDHFFVGLDSGKPSLYGRVELASESLTAAEIATKVQASSGRTHIGATVEEITRQVQLTLAAVRELTPGVPVVSDFTERRFDDKTLVQTVHRVFFGGKKKK